MASAFRNGGYLNVKIFAQTRRLASQGGYERCLLYHPYPPQSQSLHFSSPASHSAYQVLHVSSLHPAIALLREFGLRLIIYIDDILVMAESKELLRDQLQGLNYLLESRGYVINYKKSVLTPTKQVEFLSILLNSDLGILKLPQEKVMAIQQAP